MLVTASAAETHPDRFAPSQPFVIIGQNRVSAEPDQDVFVFRIGQLGDTLVALPAIHRIAELHPGARLWLITNVPPTPTMVTAWDVLTHTGLFEGVLFYRRWHPGELLQLLLRCRAGRRRLLYYLSPSRSVTQLVRDTLFLRVACGFRHIEAMPLPTRVAPRDARGHLLVLPRESERLLRSVDPQARAPATPFLRPPPAAAAKVEQLLAPFGDLEDLPLIAVGPGSKMPAKRWFLDRYLEICRRIVAHKPESRLMILGGAEDHAARQAIVETLAAERVLNLAGKPNIIESAAALSRAGLYVGNDTGTMHLAASMGVPCVAIFTSRDNRDTWSPWGEEHAILRRDLACSGCMLERCERERMRCLDLISVDDVWREVEPRLNSLRAAASSPRVLSCRS